MLTRILVVVLALGYLIEGGAGSRSDALDYRVLSAVQSLRQQMQEGWPEIGIPKLDPLKPHVKELSSSTEDAMHGQLTELTVSKISEFTIDEVDSNLLFLKSRFSLKVPLIEVTGSRYNLGAFSLQIRDVNIETGMVFGMADYDLLEVTRMELTFDCSDTEVSIEEDWENKETLLQFLELTFKTHLQKAIEYEVNLALQGGRNGDLYEEPIDDYFDRTFADMRQTIKENGLEPLILPEDSDDFVITLFNATLNGTVTVNEGRLRGLSTIHRAGNMSLDYIGSDVEVVWGGEVGLVDLETEYHFGLTFPIMGKDLRLALKMSYIHLSFETGVFILQQDLVLESCNVTEFGPVHLEEKGAGPLDSPIINLLMNVFLGELNGVVVNIVEEIICNLLETVLSSV